MFHRPGNLIDDRGQARVLLDPAAAASWPLRETRVWIITRQLAVAARRPWAQFVYGLVNIVLVVLAFVFGAFVAAVVGWGHPFFWMLVCFVIAILMARSSIGRLIRPATAQLADLLLREGLCAACGYNLHGVEQSDARIVCPECGSLWNADRILRTLPFEPSGSESVSAAAFINPEWWNDSPVPVGRDDRGTCVPLVHPRLKDVIAGASGDEAVRFQRLRRRLTKRGRFARIALAIPMLLAALLMAIAVLLHANQWGITGLAMLMFPLGLGGCGVSLLAGDHFFRRRWIIRCMKEEGLCPSCASDLLGSSPGEDGCHPCQRCHAAWRLSTASSSG